MRAAWLKKNTISRSEKAAVYAFLKWQCVIALILSLGVMVIMGQEAAQSVVLGGLITIIPNLMLAFYLFIRADKRTAKEIVRACYLGELIKLFMVAGLMVFILHFFSVQFGLFMLGFAGTYLLYWLAPVILKQAKA